MSDYPHSPDCPGPDACVCGDVPERTFSLSLADPTLALLGALRKRWKMASIGDVISTALQVVDELQQQADRGFVDVRAGNPETRQVVTINIRPIRESVAG